MSYLRKPGGKVYGGIWPCPECGSLMQPSRLVPGTVECYPCRSKLGITCTRCNLVSAHSVRPRKDKHGTYYSRLCSKCWNHGKELT